MKVDRDKTLSFAGHSGAPQSRADGAHTLEGAAPLEKSARSKSQEAWTGAASDSDLTEDSALALLKHRDLPAQTIAQLSKSDSLINSRKVKLAVVEHPRTPRHISIPALRSLYTFDLVHVAVAHAVPADIRMAAEESLINRMERLTQGERLSLARRASGRVVGELLLDPEPRVIRVALENPRLTEAMVIKTLLGPGAPAPLITAVCRHAKWSLSPEIRIALLRCEKTPLARVLQFTQLLPLQSVREIFHLSRLPDSIKAGVLKNLDGKGSTRRKKKL